MVWCGEFPKFEMLSVECCESERHVFERFVYLVSILHSAVE
jgi:hypothetical protein